MAAFSARRPARRPPRRPVVDRSVERPDDRPGRRPRRACHVGADPPHLLLRDRAFAEVLCGPLAPGLRDVVAAVPGRGGRPATPQRRGDPVREPAGGQQEAGVTDHAVLGADGEALEVPAADDGLPGLRLGEAAVVPDRLGHPGELGRRSRRSRSARRPASAPSATASRHSQGASMSRTTRSTSGSSRRQRLDEVADDEPPGRVRRRRRSSTLPRATSAKSSRRSKDEQLPLVADGAQQRQRQGAGPDAGLDDAGAGEDVGHRDDLGRVLGVDDGGAARHRHHVVGQQRAQGEVLDARGVRDDRAVGLADEVVVREQPAVGVELAARGRA